MGPCGSTSKNTHAIKPIPYQSNQNMQPAYSNNQPQVNRVQVSNSLNPQEEIYYQNVNLTTNFGGADFGPKEKIQFNVGVRSGDYGANYLAEINLSYEKSGANSTLIGRTKEEVCNSPDGSINFNISFILDYFFEKQQYLTIKVRKSGRDIVLNTTLGRVMGSRGQSLQIPFSEYGKEQFYMCANTVKNNNIQVCLTFTATQNNNPNNISLFYLIKKQKNNQQVNLNNQIGQQQEYFNIRKSELKTVGMGPTNFNTVRIPAMFLCNGDYDFPIVIEFHSPSERSILGVHSTTVNRLLSERNFTVGNLNINCNTDLVKEHTFIDYLRGGLQLSLTIGIDFTGSNGHPHDSESLHRIDTSGKPNQYQAAIRACGDILAYYDYDQIFPTYGYGALLPGTREVNHCFPLNMNNDPSIQSIDGVLDVYRQVMPNLTFSGPTNFTPLINQTIYNIKNQQNKAVYHILLILTDGMITDMDDTVATIIEGSSLPLSIIIVGIGTGDFGNMDTLDGDSNALVDNRGRRVTRDIVQFVPFYKFSNNGAKLAEQVLAEIPRQVVDYHKMINRPPGDPIINI